MALTQISTDGIKDGTITGADLATNVDLVDNKKIRFGTGSDLEIFHNGTSNIIEATNGDLNIRMNSSENAIVARQNGAVELYHDNSKKFETISSGASVTGSLGINTTSPSGGKLHISHGNELGLFTSGSYNFQAKFESTDAEAAIVIEDNGSTNNGNRIGVISDDMAFTTAGSERMRIDSSGDVSIGSTTNGGANRLNVVNNESGDFVNPTDATLRITNSNASNDTRQASIAFTVATTGSGSDSAIVCTSESGGNSNLRFFTDTSNGMSEKMRIDSSGNLCIGTTTGDTPITVSRATTGNVLKGLSTNNNTRSRITLSGKDTSGNAVTLMMGGDGDFGGMVFTNSNHKLGFATNNAAPQMILDTSGRVGIGTTSPAHKLHIKDSSANPLLLVERGSGSHTFMEAQTDKGVFGTGNNHPVYFLQNSGTAMVIDTNKNVGIGTTSPDVKLTVATSSGDAYVRVTGGTNQGLLLNKSDGTLIGGIVSGGAGGATVNDITIRTESGNNITFAHGVTERMRITSGGKLLVGSSADLYNNNIAEFVTASESAVVGVRSSAGAVNQKYIAFKYGGGPTNGGGIRRDGSAQTPEFYSDSDRRIKKDIVDFPNQLDKINQIQLKSFGYKNNPDDLGRGPIAQDLIKVYPNKVNKSDGDDGTGETVPDGVEPWTIGTNFTWELIKAIQELSAEVAALKAS